ncbi:hypothetical protein CMUS01_12473 [Colletotrichum musicola]|uniref:F-box domain-containing protein n=1 Tax=Colletotrichum musicola TaxID=2175873 RepID=A0A8H6JLT4_9PEZI|nr:hypothetical protein CMUS01_12473 [Colletotrichum musicola]
MTHSRRIKDEPTELPEGLLNFLFSPEHQQPPPSMPSRDTEKHGPLVLDCAWDRNAETTVSRKKNTMVFNHITNLVAMSTVATPTRASFQALPAEILLQILCSVIDEHLWRAMRLVRRARTFAMKLMWRGFTSIYNLFSSRTGQINPQLQARSSHPPRPRGCWITESHALYSRAQTAILPTKHNLR